MADERKLVGATDKHRGEAPKDNVRPDKGGALDVKDAMLERVESDRALKRGDAGTDGPSRPKRPEGER
ncbi:hypothetical protein [Rhizobium sp. SL86]|uniref:hypothetical protein n=1 Tax=Rhizobium sp. SL86 TaxID=2995148 RepID=UPI00227329C7|nr:hypothetical protein [Rhizobium sp. SL86]MCY1663895.1 hypothetical protein [Rhizobium sp. SL86]